MTIYLKADGVTGNVYIKPGGLEKEMIADAVGTGASIGAGILGTELKQPLFF